MLLGEQFPDSVDFAGSDGNFFYAFAFFFALSGKFRCSFLVSLGFAVSSNMKKMLARRGVASKIRFLSQLDAKVLKKSSFFVIFSKMIIFASFDPVSCLSLVLLSLE